MALGVWSPQEQSLEENIEMFAIEGDSESPERAESEEGEAGDSDVRQEETA